MCTNVCFQNKHAAYLFTFIHQHAEGNLIHGIGFTCVHKESVLRCLSAIPVLGITISVHAIQARPHLAMNTQPSVALTVAMALLLSGCACIS